MAVYKNEKEWKKAMRKQTKSICADMIKHLKDRQDKILELLKKEKLEEAHNIHIILLNLHHQFWEDWQKENKN